MPTKDELIFTDSDLAAIGATTWWTFFPVRREDLRAKLQEQQLDELFKLPRITPDSALRRMMESAKDVYPRQSEARFMIRPVRGKRGEWALVKEIGTDQGRNRYETYLTAKLINERPYFEWIVGPSYGPNQGSASYLTEQFQKALDTLMADDLSGWVKGILRDRFDATLLRDAGGVWFVPKAKVAGLRLLEAIFMPQLTVVRSGRTESLVHNLIESMRAEAKKQMEEINSWYEANTEFSDRNLRTRKAHESTLKDLKAKIERYEKIVEKPMLDIQSDLLSMKNKVSMTFFKAAAAAQGQSVQEGTRLIEIDDKHVEPSPEEASEPDRSDRMFSMVLDEVNRPDKPAAEDTTEDEGRKVDIE